MILLNILVKEHTMVTRGHTSDRKKLLCSPVILHPRQLPISPLPWAGPAPGVKLDRNDSCFLSDICSDWLFGPFSDPVKSQNKKQLKHSYIFYIQPPMRIITWFQHRSCVSLGWYRSCHILFRATWIITNSGCNTCVPPGYYN